MRGAGEATYPNAPGFQAHSPTSEAAAKAILPKLGDLHRRVYAYLKQRGGATDEQGQEALGLGPNTYRPRRRELQLHGFVIESGRKEKTRSGHDAVVWVVSGKARGNV